MPSLSTPPARVPRSRTPEYRSWEHMRDRCGNPRSKKYPRYGGRGIRVCAEWQVSFDAFFAYVGPRPSPAHTLDRFPNNDGDYEPNNVRWATKQEQSWNSSCVHMIELQGERLPIAEWARRLNLGASRVAGRLARGRSPLEAFVPLTARDAKARDTVQRRGRVLRITFSGETLNASQWSRRTGLPWPVIVRRIYDLGWSVDRALTTPNNRVKLSQAAADDIRLLRAGGMPVREIALRYKVRDPTVRKVLKGKRWRGASAPAVGAPLENVDTAIVVAEGRT